MSGRNPAPSYTCTLTLIAMQGHQQKGRQTNTSSNNKDKSNTIIETSTAEDHDDENLHNNPIIVTHLVLAFHPPNYVNSLNSTRRKMDPFCFVAVVVVVSHIQRIGCQPEKTTLHGGQSRSWSAEQGKENKRKSLAAYPPPPTPHTARSEKINKITRRIYRRYAGGRSRVRTRIPSARRLGLWVYHMSRDPDFVFTHPSMINIFLLKKQLCGSTKPYQPTLRKVIDITLQFIMRGNKK